MLAPRTNLDKFILPWAIPAPGGGTGFRVTMAIAVLACLVPLTSAEDKPAAPPVVPLRHAHAHNDYEHPRPLFDALAHGFCSVEADIYLRSNQLLVGHLPWDLK